MENAAGASGIVLHYNLCRNRSSVELQPIDETWDLFVRNLRQPSIRDSKDGPSIVPARFKPGGTRRAADAISHTLLVLDLDNKGNTLTKERIVEVLQDWVYAAHTTHSATIEHPKWRIFIPLTEEVDHETYVAMYNFFSHVFGDEMDASCVDIARLFFLPATKDANTYDCWESASVSSQTFGRHNLPSVLPDRERGRRSDRTALTITNPTAGDGTGTASPLLDVIPKGQIDNTFVSIAGVLWGYGCTLEDVSAVLESMARRTEVPVTPNHIPDVLNTIRRYTRGQRNLQVQDFSAQHAIISVDGDTRILKEDWDPVLQQPKITLFSVGSFQAFYAYRKEDAIAWLMSPLARRYDGFTFDPETDHHGRYNLWKGFAYTPVEGNLHARYMDHIAENVCGGDTDIYRWVVTWMADIVKKPGHLCGTSLVLRGEQGTGKGVMLRNFGALFGQHYKHVTNRQNIVGNFNSLLSDAVFVYADEALYAGDRQMEGRLKAIITEPTITIELKGVNPFIVKNCIHLAMSSNHDRVVPAGIDERRFAVIDVSSRHQTDYNYFSRIQTEMDAGGYANLLHFLGNWESEVNTSHIPQTAALRSQKVLSLERNVEHFALFLAGAQNRRKYYKLDIYEDYQRFARDNWLTPTRYWMSLMKYITKNEDYFIKRDHDVGEFVVFGTTETNTIENARKKFAAKMRMTWEDMLEALSSSDIDVVSKGTLKSSKGHDFY